MAQRAFQFRPPSGRWRMDQLLDSIEQALGRRPLDASYAAGWLTLTLTANDPEPPDDPNLPPIEIDWTQTVQAVQAVIDAYKIVDDYTEEEKEKSERGTEKMAVRAALLADGFTVPDTTDEWVSHIGQILDNAKTVFDVIPLLRYLAIVAYHTSREAELRGRLANEEPGSVVQ